jgi:hypothetical protein
MSRYMVNKAMWEIDQSTETLAAFKNDASAFLEGWESQAPRPTSLYPQGGSLTAPERQALEAKDFGSLYAMGVNPFLLWQFARSVSVPDEMSVEELVASFREAVASHGYPDFFT